MEYSLTDKLTFNEAPKIHVGEDTLTVNTDAIAILKLLSSMKNKSESEAVLEAYELLFSDEDKARIESWHLDGANFTTLVQSAMALAMGEDPDAEEQKQGE